MTTRTRIFAAMIAAVVGVTLTGGGAAWWLTPGPEPLPIDPDVTESNVAETICIAGWSKARRPGAHVMGKIKLALLAARGEPAERKRAYILDHQIPLQLGGAGRDTRNLELNLTADEKEKDRIENKLKCLVCTGAIDLRTAQRAIWYDWRAAAQRYAEVHCTRPRRAKA